MLVLKLRCDICKHLYYPVLTEELDYIVRLTLIVYNKSLPAVSQKNPEYKLTADLMLLSKPLGYFIRARCPTLT